MCPGSSGNGLYVVRLSESPSQKAKQLPADNILNMCVFPGFTLTKSGSFVQTLSFTDKNVLLFNMISSLSECSRRAEFLNPIKVAI